MDMARPPQSIPQARPYQQEMLAESLKRNVIIAMDTGSGKTLIAILRIKIEAERNPDKISWFITPTVALCEQQRDVIATSLAVPVGLVSGAQMPEQWTNEKTWRATLESHKIIVSTPQVLLDALRHGYVNMASQIGLLVFDEAHHAADKHPYNVIMREFYDKCKTVSTVGGTEKGAGPRPLVLGLTASPMFGGNVAKAFEKLEVNLDSVILTPQATRDDLVQHVSRPQYSIVRYPAPEDASWRKSRNTLVLECVYKSLDIEKDPQICSMRLALAKPVRDKVEQKRIDQRLSQALDKKDTFVHKGMRDFFRTAQAICIDIGIWAADWFVASVVKRALKGDAEIIHQFFIDRKQREKAYLIEVLRRIEVDTPEWDDDDISQLISVKTNAFIECVTKEKAQWESRGEQFSGLAFITRRDGALALSELLNRHPVMKDAGFSIGTLLGGTESSRRNAFLDITRTLLRESHADVIFDFRVGERNLVIATAVAEEGLDIQACCTVLRWDPPSNMVSFAQSRGRARRKASSLILLAEDGAGQEDAVRKWEAMERQMKEAYCNEDRLRRLQLRQLEESDSDDDVYDEFAVEETGAKVTLDSSVSHIAHFCNVLPSKVRSEVLPIYDITPPDYPVAFHSLSPEERRATRSENLGPFGASLTLPRLLPPELRYFTTGEIHSTKKAAQRQVAFQAYKALYEAHLLNDNLLPIGSTIYALQDEEVKALLREVQKRDGVADVLQELDPWAIEDIPSDSNSWWSNIVKVDGLGSFDMFTRRKIPQMDFKSDCLYDPHYGIRHFTVRPGKGSPVSSEDKCRAEAFTRRMFSVLHRVNIDDTSQLSYLFLPTKNGVQLDNESVWADRRSWAGQTTSNGDGQNPFLVNARLFGGHYDHPSDIFMVSSGGLYLFKGWKFEKLSQDEQDILRKKYARYPDLKVEYPAIIGERLTHRRDFLVAPSSGLPSQSAKRQEILLPQFSEVVLEDAINLQFALFLPSILRAVTIKLISKAFTESFLNRVLLRKIPLETIQTALLTPSANSLQNYQRLETVGDAVLKLVTSVHLLQAHPHWPEGYLTRRKDHAVSNACLAKMAIERKLYAWIIRQGFRAKKWKPSYSSRSTTTKNDDSEAPVEAKPEDEVVDDENDEEVVDDVTEEAELQSEVYEPLSTKVLADVVEALTGAAFVTAGFDCSIDFLDSFKFDIGTPWKQMADCLEAAVADIGTLEVPQKNIDHAEQILGYVFKRKMLAVEALMHVSSESAIDVVSYERMEFLGDAVLDLVVVKALYQAEKEGKVFNPGEMHIRKAALVNMHLLAYLCLKAGRTMETEIGDWDYTSRKETLRTSQHTILLSQCLFHSSTYIIDKERDSRTRFHHCKDAIGKALEEGGTFPWAALAHLQAPKFLSDIIESLAGAIYLDSKGDMAVVEAFLEGLGFMRVLRRLISEPIELRHPVTKITEWASTHHKVDDLELKVEKVGERVHCTLCLDGKVLVEDFERYNGKLSEEDVKLRVAEKGMALLASM